MTLSDHEKRIVVGSRVVIARPENYLQPLRRLAEEGRVGTVALIEPPRFRAPIKVVFDVKRKNAKPVSDWFYANDLELSGAHRSNQGDGK